MVDYIYQCEYNVFMEIDRNNIKTAGSRLAKVLAEQGSRIFTRKYATRIAIENGYSESFATKIVLHMCRGGWIEMIRPGLYALNSIFLGGHPIHEFEILTSLAENVVVSHFSAMNYYAFTEQIPHSLYGTVPTGTNIPRKRREQPLTIQGNTYHFVQIKESQFFGHRNIWVGDVRIKITDKERTLLDGLIKPGSCGGLQEVLNAYKMNIGSINIETLVNYALRLDKAVAKRLGWILEELGVDDVLLAPLLNVPYTGYILLDASGEKSGLYNKKWHIQENL